MGDGTQPLSTAIPFGMITVVGHGQACSASWQGGTFKERGTVELDTVGGPDDWWVARAIVQGPRSKGIGSTLLQAALAKAVEMGARTVRVVPGGYGADPDDQEHFYERNGFEKTLEHGEPVWVWRSK